MPHPYAAFRRAVLQAGQASAPAATCARAARTYTCIWTRARAHVHTRAHTRRRQLWTATSDSRHVTTVQLARAARALRAARAAQAGLSKSSRGALAGLGADIARLHAWLRAARAGAARRGKEGGSSASSPYAWGKGEGGGVRRCR